MRKLSIALCSLALMGGLSFAQVPVKVTPTSSATAKLLPGTRTGVLSTIEGKAISAVNTPMAGTTVRLRDARAGRIVNTTTTDKLGAFAFHEIDPGTYVVELMNNNAVIASSPLLNVGTGDAVSALVRVPFTTSTVASALGSSQSTAAAITNAAQVVTAAAAASNVAAQTFVGAAATSTNATNGR
jgi:SdrD B-like protein